MSEKRPFKIVFTGPESSGKTTISQLTAATYQSACLSEYARTYLEATKGVYQAKDLVLIAKGQAKMEQQFIADNASKPMLFFDTSHLVLKIWSSYKYGFYNFEIEKLLRANLPDCYFLCDWNIPWEADPLRENPEDRDILYEIYKNELAVLKVPFFELNGSIENRLRQINMVLQKW